MKSFFIATIGVICIVSPIDWRMKIPIAGVSALPLTVHLWSERKKFYNLKSLSQKEQEALEKINIEKSRIEIEVGNGKLQIEAEIQRLEQKRTLVTSESQDLELLKEKIKQDCDRLVRDAKRKANQIAFEKETELAKREGEVNRLEKELDYKQKFIDGSASGEVDFERRKMEKERATWAAEVERIVSWVAEQKEYAQKIVDEAKAKRASDRNQMLANLSQINEKQKADLEAMKIQVETEIKITKANTEADVQLWEAEKLREKNELEKHIKLEQQKLLNQLEIYKEKYLADVEEESRDIIEDLAAQKAEPHLKQLKQAVQVIQQQKSEIVSLRNKVASMNKVIKPTATDPLSTVAHRFITFYEERGVYIDFINRYELNRAIIVTFRGADWHYFGKFEAKYLKRYYEELKVAFNLEEDPEVAIEAEGWLMKLVPRQSTYLTSDAKPPEFRPLLEDNPNRENVDPIYIKASDNLDKLEEEDRMLTFFEPTTPCPRSGEVTQTELDWVKWLYFYRQKYTGEPNITRQNDLLERLYDVTVGRATEDPQADGKTLRDRLAEIFLILGIESRRKRS